MTIGGLRTSADQETPIAEAEAADESVWDYDESDGSIFVKLSDKLTWHDSDAVTASDLLVDHDINFAISDIVSPDSSASTYISDYEAVDDYAIRYHLYDDFTLGSVIANEFGDS
ncbi:hypothetical protein [Halomontanus rarus]|uniref:hypothetical protein n=1 Tax=Halomontanus rarus TaxID=3034020 RepID=UPI001A9A0E5D